MLNNSININKNETIKSHLKSLNIKMKKYHEYGKAGPRSGQTHKCGEVKYFNEISSVIFKTNNNVSSYAIEHKKGPRDIMSEMQVLARDKHTYVARLNQLMGYQSSLLDDCIFIVNDVY